MCNFTESSIYFYYLLCYDALAETILYTLQKVYDACVLGVDIGAYDTCGHLCKYCYANADVNLVKENRKKHNPKSPFLIGESMSGDVIHEAEQKNWIDRQLRFDFF